MAVAGIQEDGLSAGAREADLAGEEVPADLVDAAADVVEPAPLQIHMDRPVVEVLVGVIPAAEGEAAGEPGRGPRASENAGMSSERRESNSSAVNPRFPGRG